MLKTLTETDEATARKARVASTLDAIENCFATAEASGSLADRLRDVVLENRQKTTKAWRVPSRI